MVSHVFVFRPCVRSAVVDEDFEYRGARHHARDFFFGNGTLPSDGGGCTERGVDVLRGTGRRLAREYGGKNMRFRFVAWDDDPVGAASLLALWHGLREEEPASSPAWTTMTFHADRCAPSSDSYDAHDLHEEIARRRTVVPAPEPGWEEELTGMPDVELETEHLTEDVAGDLLAFYARLSLQSRLSDGPAWAPATTTTVAATYRRSRWAGRSESVSHVGTTVAAARGARAAVQVLDALRQDDTVTVFLGERGPHDLATVFDLRWQLPAPYHDPTADYMSAPPGSALHLHSNDQDGTLGLSMHYPVFFHLNNFDETTLLQDVILDTSGTLHTTPVSLTDHQDQNKTDQNRSGGIQALGDRLRDVLTTHYPQALPCYQHAVASPRDDTAHDDQPVMTHHDRDDASALRVSQVKHDLELTGLTAVTAATVYLAAAFVFLVLVSPVYRRTVTRRASYALRRRRQQEAEPTVDHHGSNPNEELFAAFLSNNYTHDD